MNAPEGSDSRRREVHGETPSFPTGSKTSFPSIFNSFKVGTRRGLLPGASLVLCFLLPMGWASFPASGRARAPRDVSIRLVIEDGYRFGGTWQFQATRVVQNCAVAFRTRFGIDLHVREYGNWRPGRGSATLGSLLSDLMAGIPPGGCDIVVGLLGPGRPAFGGSGISSYLDGYVLLNGGPACGATERLLTHELCHLFGARDLLEKGSVMGTKEPGRRFDDLTARVVTLNRDRVFDRRVFPVSVEALDEMTGLFRERAAKGLGEDDVLVMLSHLCQLKEDWAGGLDAMEEALRIHPDLDCFDRVLDGILFGDATEPSIRAYRETLLSERGYPELHIRLGLELLAGGFSEAAGTEFAKAIKADPGYSVASYDDQGLSTK